MSVRTISGIPIDRQVHELPRNFSIFLNMHSAPYPGLTVLLHSLGSSVQQQHEMRGHIPSATLILTCHYLKGVQRQLLQLIRVTARIAPRM